MIFGSTEQARLRLLADWLVLQRTRSTSQPPWMSHNISWHSPSPSRSLSPGNDRLPNAALPYEAAASRREEDSKQSPSKVSPSSSASAATHCIDEKRDSETVPTMTRSRIVVKPRLKSGGVRGTLTAKKAVKGPSESKKMGDPMKENIMAKAMPSRKLLMPGTPPVPMTFPCGHVPLPTALMKMNCKGGQAIPPPTKVAKQTFQDLRPPPLLSPAMPHADGSNRLPPPRPPDLPDAKPQLVPNRSRSRSRAMLQSTLANTREDHGAKTSSQMQHRVRLVPKRNRTPSPPWRRNSTWDNDDDGWSDDDAWCEWRSR